MKNEVEITHFLDKDGDPIVSVTLSNTDKKAILYQEDFNRLYEFGIDPRWRLTQGQVYVRGRKRTSVARLIFDAKQGDKITYLDKDPLNLKRNNLACENGAGKYKAREAASPRPSSVSLKHVYISPPWQH